MKAVWTAFAIAAAAHASPMEGQYPFAFMDRAASAKSVAKSFHNVTETEQRWEWRLSRDDEIKVHNLGGKELDKLGLIQSVVKACGKDVSTSTFTLKNGGKVLFGYAGKQGFIRVILPRH